MNKWISTAAGISGLSDCHLLLQAQDFAVKCGFQKDDIKEGWVSRWKSRIGLKSKRIHGESGDVDNESVNYWRNSRIKDILSQ